MFRRFFRWLIDRWHIHRVHELNRRDTIGRYAIQVEQERERHRRETESKDAIIAINLLEKKTLLETLETVRAELAKTQAVLTRGQAEAEYSMKRSTGAGGAAP